MDDRIADFITDIPLKADAAAGDRDGVFEAGIDSAQATQQERLFHEDLSRWSTMAPGSADTAMNPFAGDPTTAHIGLNRTRTSSKDDVQAQLRALSARNAFLSLALDAAVAESASLKAEHAELATLAAQSTVARQRHEAEIAEAKKAQQLLRTELEGAQQEVVRLHSENQALQATVEQRSVSSSAEQERLAAEAIEATRARKQAEAQLVRLQRSSEQTVETLEHQRATVARLQNELRDALAAAEDHETQRIAEQVDFTAAAAEASAARQRLEGDLKRLQQKQRQTGNALEKSRAEGRRLQSALDAALAAQRDLEATVARERESAEAGHRDLDALRTELTVASEREAAVRRDLDEAQAALRRAATETADEHRQLEAQLTEAHETHRRMAKTLEFLQAEVARLRQQLEHAGAHEREATARWDAERTSFVLTIDQAASRRRHLEAELREARQTQQLLGDGIGQARHEIERLSRLQPRIEALERERDGLRVSKEQAVDQLNHLLEVARRETAEAIEAVKSVRAERDELAAQLPFRDAAMQALRDELETLRSSLQSPSVAAAVPIVEDGVAVRRMQARIDAQAENRQRYAEEMRGLRKRIAELEAACRKLESTIAGSASR